MSAVSDKIAPRGVQPKIRRPDHSSRYPLASVPTGGRAVRTQAAGRRVGCRQTLVFRQRPRRPEFPSFTIQNVHDKPCWNGQCAEACFERFSDMLIGYMRSGSSTPAALSGTSSIAVAVPSRERANAAGRRRPAIDHMIGPRMCQVLVQPPAGITSAIPAAALGARPQPGAGRSPRRRVRPPSA